MYCYVASTLDDLSFARSNTLHGLALLQHRPEPGWCLQYLQSIQPQLASFSAQELAVAAWSLGALRYRPPKPWVLHFMLYAKQARGLFLQALPNDVMWVV